MFDYYSALRLINSLFTIGLGLFLIYLYLKKEVRFISLLVWSIAFISYGFQILARIWYPWNALEVLILNLIPPTLLIMGTSNIIRQNKIYGAYSLIGNAIAIFLFPSYQWVQFGIFGFFGAMTVAVIHLRLVVGKIADRFIVGWMTLFFSNLLFVGVVKIEWLADLLAIPAKGLLALGMIDQKFARMILDIKEIFKTQMNSR